MSSGLGFTPAGVTTTLELIDYVDLTNSAKADAAGVATVIIGPSSGSGLYLLIVSIALSTSDGLGTQCGVYKGALGAINLVNATSKPGLDFSTGQAPIILYPNMPLILYFTGMTPGATASARVQAQVVQKTIAKSGA